MWTMTTKGFYSAVQHREDASLLVVRTRDHADAERLEGWYADWMDQLAAHDTTAVIGMPDPAITSYDHSDYPWRVILPRTAYGAFLAETVEDLDYGNFKDAVKANQGHDRAQVYSSVWSVLLRLEDLDPDGRPTPAWEDLPWDDEDPEVWAQYADWEAR